LRLCATVATRVVDRGVSIQETLIVLQALIFFARTPTDQLGGKEIPRRRKIPSLGKGRPVFQSPGEGGSLAPRVFSVSIGGGRKKRKTRNQKCKSASGSSTIKGASDLGY